MLLAAEVAVLLGGFAYASVADLREREVTDRLWQVMGAVGVVLGAVIVAPGGGLPLALWVVVGGFTLQHLFPWDAALGGTFDRFADVIEGIAYLVVILVVAVATVRFGIGPAQVPLSVLALLFTVLFARGLFELGVLYGGADAKALMVAGALVPLLPPLILSQTPAVSALLTVLPFSVNLLMNAALVSIVIPIVIAARNVVRGEFRFPQGFSGYEIAVRELPHRFVWLRDPLIAERDDPAETSEEDRLQRVQQARELEAKGIERVWVTPQIPFLVLMAIGAVAALLAGNLVLDLLVRL